LGAVAVVFLGLLSILKSFLSSSPFLVFSIG
jgi:hypothetical protein